MIKSIEMKNWKTHKNTRLDFSKGTTILLGQMGAGKSSVMDAISFALFGTYPAIQHRRVSVEEIIMNRPEQKEMASVKLDFEADGETYSVERILELGGGTKATISKGTTYLQSQTQRVNEEVEKILKVDYDLFSRAIYSEQNRLTYFLELRPADRKKQIDQLLGLDKFAAAQENSTSLINKIKDIIGESEKTIAALDVKKMEEQYRALTGEMEKLAEERKGLSEEIGGNEANKTAVEKKLKEAKEAYVTKTTLIKEVAELVSRIGVIEKEMKKIEERGISERSVLEKRLAEAKSLFEDLAKKEAAADKEEKVSFEKAVRAETESKNAEKEKGEREKLLKGYDKEKVAELEKTLAKVGDDAKKFATECEAAIAGRNENRKWLEELKKHWSKCPVCDTALSEEARSRILGDRTKAVETLDAQIEKLKKGKEKAESETEKCRKELEEKKRIAEKLKDYEGLDERMAKLSKDLEDARKDSAALRKTKDEAKEAAAKAKEAFSKLESERETISRMESYTADRLKWSKALDEKEKAAAKIEVTEGFIDGMQKEFTLLNVLIKELDTKLDSNTKSEKEKTALAKEKKGEIETVSKMQAQVKKKRNAIENIAKFKIALEETQTTLRSRLIGSINGIMQEVWPELYPYGDYRDITLEPTSDDYVLKVKTARGGEEKWEEVDTIASGGEKSVACLTMRVAFALVLVPNLRWMILDEPTHNIDQLGLQRFMKAINEVLPRLVDQVFIITHDETLKEVENARIYVMSRNKEKGESTSVESYMA